VTNSHSLPNTTVTDDGVNVTQSRNGTEQKLAKKKAYTPRNGPRPIQPAGAAGARGGNTDKEGLNRVEERQENLIQRVAQMNETIILMKAMIEKILSIAEQPPPKSDISETLQYIAEILLGQQQALGTIDERLLALPDMIVEALTTE